MSDRFEGLTRIPDQPAARMLAVANARLGIKLEAPASATVPAVLAELEKKGAVIDMLRMLAVALPARERVWWACLAARDMLAGGAIEDPAIIEATEAWVYEPDDAKLAEIHRLVQIAEPDDASVLAATAALYSGGKLGPGELANIDAPPGGSEAHALVMAAQAVTHDTNRCDEMAALMIDRALDIARGGQGDVKPKKAGG